MLICQLALAPLAADDKTSQEKDEEEEIMRRTFQPNRRRRSRTHGFRVRMRSRGGRAVLSRRRRKGRQRLAV